MLGIIQKTINITLFLAISFVWAQDKSSVLWHTVDEGEWTRVYLKNSLFPHESRKENYTYKSLVFTPKVNYSDSSAIVFMPKGYKTINGVNDILVHFHGWNNEVLNVMHDFNILGQLYKSKKNAILVLAQGPKNAMDSAGGKMEDRNGLKKYLSEILIILNKEKKIQTDKIGEVIISAHSGGYRPAILGLINGGLQKNVREIFLFDAFYTFTDKLIPWLKEDKDNKLRSIYTEHLAPEHREFLKLIAQQGLTYNNVLKPETKIMLKFTRVCHDCVMEGTLEEWLEASSFSDISR